MSPNGEATVWKFVSGILATALLSIVGTYATTQKETVSKADLSVTLATQQRQLDDHTAQLAEIKQTLVQLEVDTGRISEHLGVAAHPSSKH